MTWLLIIATYYGGMQTVEVLDEHNCKQLANSIPADYAACYDRLTGRLVVLKD